MVEDQTIFVGDDQADRAFGSSSALRLEIHSEAYVFQICALVHTFMSFPLVLPFLFRRPTNLMPTSKARHDRRLSRFLFSTLIDLDLIKTLAEARKQSSIAHLT